MAASGINGTWSYVPFSKISVEPLSCLNFHTDLSATGSTPGNGADPWKWDDLHVHMPCSQRNVGHDRKARWPIIKEIFGNKFYPTGYLLGDTIKSYNRKYAATWRFNCLEEFSKQNRELFATVVPDIIDLAMQLPVLVRESIPILRVNHEASVTLSQIQIASLLANAFLCTFPWRNDPSQSGSLPTINFNGLFEQQGQSAVEKINCIFHYFKRVCETCPTGKVTFTRRVHHNRTNWKSSNKPLLSLQITDTGNIEEDGQGMLQVDFANKMIGGGVLGRGAVQEEIRFAISPELIVARLFTEELQDNEALVITGTERFNMHAGYAKSFRYASNFQDNTYFDDAGRRRCSIVAIDAIHFHNPGVQYLNDKVNRELNKAFAGFSVSYVDPSQLSPIATGNWGCGAFNGDPRLKALIQLMAASEAGRELRYFTHGDKELVKELVELCGYLDAFDITTVGKLYEKLELILRSRPTNVLDALTKHLYSGGGTSDSDKGQPTSGQSSLPEQHQATTSGSLNYPQSSPGTSGSNQDQGHGRNQTQRNNGLRRGTASSRVDQRMVSGNPLDEGERNAEISPELCRLSENTSSLCFAGFRRITRLFLLFFCLKLLISQSSEDIARNGSSESNLHLVFTLNR